MTSAAWTAHRVLKEVGTKLHRHHADDELHFIRKKNVHISELADYDVFRDAGAAVVVADTDDLKLKTVTVEYYKKQEPTCINDFSAAMFVCIVILSAALTMLIMAASGVKTKDCPRDTMLARNPVTCYDESQHDFVAPVWTPSFHSKDFSVSGMLGSFVFVSSFGIVGFWFIDIRKRYDQVLDDVSVTPATFACSIIATISYVVFVVGLMNLGACVNDGRCSNDDGGSSARVMTCVGAAVFAPCVLNVVVDMHRRERRLETRLQRQLAEARLTAEEETCKA